MQSSTDTLRARVEHFIDVWDAGDFDTLRRLFAEDARLVHQGRGTFLGRDCLEKFDGYRVPSIQQNRDQRHTIEYAIFGTDHLGRQAAAVETSLSRSPSRPVLLVVFNANGEIQELTCKSDTLSFAHEQVRTAMAQPPR
jgi:hypothetical protein